MARDGRGSTSAQRSRDGQGRAAAGRGAGAGVPVKRALFVDTTLTRSGGGGQWATGSGPAASPSAAGARPAVAFLAAGGRTMTGGGKSALHSESKGGTWGQPSHVQRHALASSASSAPIGEREPVMSAIKARHAGGIADGSARVDAGVSMKPVRSLRQMLQQRREQEGGRCNGRPMELANRRSEHNAHSSDHGRNQEGAGRESGGGWSEMGVEGRGDRGENYGCRVIHAASRDFDFDRSSGSEEDEGRSAGNSPARTGKLVTARRFAELLAERGYAGSGSKADIFSIAGGDGGEPDVSPPRGSLSGLRSSVSPHSSTPGQRAQFGEREAQATNYPAKDASSKGAKNASVGGIDTPEKKSALGPECLYPDLYGFSQERAWRRKGAPEHDLVIVESSKRLSISMPARRHPRPKLCQPHSPAPHSPSHFEYAIKEIKRQEQLVLESWEDIVARKVKQAKYFDVKDEQFKRALQFEVETRALHKGLIVQYKITKGMDLRTMATHFRLWYTATALALASFEFKERLRLAYKQSARKNGEQALIRWQVNVRKQLRRKSILLRVTLRLHFVCLTAAWDGWVETVLLLKRRAAKYVRVLHVWKHRSMFAAFRSMANFLKETLALREKQRWILMRWMHMTTFQYLDSWCLEVRRRRIERRVVLRWQCAFLTQAWNQWFAGHYQRQWSRRKRSAAASAVIRRFSRAILQRIFRSWSLVFAESLARRNLDRIVSKSQVRGTTRHKSRTFSLWHTYAEEKYQMRRMTRKLARHFKFHTVAAVWGAWKRMSMNGKTQRSLTMCAVQHWANYTVTAAWGEWKNRHFVSRRRRTISKRSVLRWSHRILFRFWYFWQSLRMKQNAQTRRLTQLLTRWTNYTKAVAFSVWKDGEQGRAEEQQKQVFLQRFVMRMLNRSIHLTFEHWLGHAQEEAQMKAKARKVVRRLKDRVFAGCFDAWHSYADEKVRKRRLTKKIVLRMTGDTVSGAFNRWQFYVRQLTEEREEEERKHNLIQKFILRMLNRAMIVVLERWACIVYELKETRRLDRGAKNITLRWWNGCKRQAVKKWKQQTIRRRRFAVTVSRIMVKMHWIGISHSFLCWHRHMSRHKNLWSWTALLAGKMARAFLQHWHAFTEKSTRTGQLVSKAILVWLQRKQCQAFFHWRDTVCALIAERTASAADLVLRQTQSALAELQTSCDHIFALTDTVESDISSLKHEFKSRSEALILRTEKSIIKAALLARKQEKEALTDKWEGERMRREAEYEEQKVTDNNRWMRERETLRLYAKEKEAEIQQRVLDKETEHAAARTLWMQQQREQESFFLEQLQEKEAISQQRQSALLERIREAELSALQQLRSKQDFMDQRLILIQADLEQARKEEAELSAVLAKEREHGEKLAVEVRKEQQGRESDNARFREALDSLKTDLAAAHNRQLVTYKESLVRYTMNQIVKEQESLQASLLSSWKRILPLARLKRKIVENAFCRQRLAVQKRAMDAFHDEAATTKEQRRIIIGSAQLNAMHTRWMRLRFFYAAWNSYTQFRLRNTLHHMSKSFQQKNPARMWSSLQRSARNLHHDHKRSKHERIKVTATAKQSEEDSPAAVAAEQRGAAEEDAAAEAARKKAEDAAAAKKAEEDVEEAARKKAAADRKKDEDASVEALGKLKETLAAEATAQDNLKKALAAAAEAEAQRKANEGAAAVAAAAAAQAAKDEKQAQDQVADAIKKKAEEEDALAAKLKAAKEQHDSLEKAAAAAQDKLKEAQAAAEAAANQRKASEAAAEKAAQAAAASVEQQGAVSEQSGVGVVMNFFTNVFSPSKIPAPVASLRPRVAGLRPQRAKSPQRKHVAIGQTKSKPRTVRHAGEVILQVRTLNPETAAFIMVKVFINWRTLAHDRRIVNGIHRYIKLKQIRMRFRNVIRCLSEWRHQFVAARNMAHARASLFHKKAEQILAEHVFDGWKAVFARNSLHKRLFGRIMARTSYRKKEFLRFAVEAWANVVFNMWAVPRRLEDEFSDTLSDTSAQKQMNQLRSLRTSISQMSLEIDKGSDISDGVKVDGVMGDARQDAHGAAREGTGGLSLANYHRSPSANVHQVRGHDNDGYRLTESGPEGGVRELGGVGALYQRLSRLGSDE